jgi:hypothetical protein
MDHANEVLAEMVEHGGITAAERARMVLGSGRGGNRSYLHLQE